MEFDALEVSGGQSLIYQKIVEDSCLSDLRIYSHVYVAFVSAVRD